METVDKLQALIGQQKYRELEKNKIYLRKTLYQ
jgi:hypothetical protein